MAVRLGVTGAGHRIICHVLWPHFLYELETSASRWSSWISSGDVPRLQRDSLENRGAYVTFGGTRDGKWLVVMGVKRSRFDH